MIITDRRKKKESSWVKLKALSTNVGGVKSKTYSDSQNPL